MKTKRKNEDYESFIDRRSGDSVHVLLRKTFCLAGSIFLKFSRSDGVIYCFKKKEKTFLNVF